MPVKIILKQVKYLASLERMAGGGEKYTLTVWSTYAQLMHHLHEYQL